MSHDAHLRIGVSACLLGTEVRFDGQHKRDPFLVNQLGAYVEYVSVCPEVEVGMGVPRESVRLVRGPAGRSLMLGNQSREDWTERMTRYAEGKAKKLAKLELDGYVLKAKSPSCGMERVKLYDTDKDGSYASSKGVGLFAAALMAELPNLPVEEEGRLNDPHLRENFIERVFAYNRVRALWRTRWTIGDLVAFHTAHKLTLLAHSVEAYRAMGRLVAEAKKMPRDEVRAMYESGFMAALKKVATRGRHTNVMMHMLGHLRGELPDVDRKELLEQIEDYSRGLVPLVVPLTLMRHHVVRQGIEYLRGQTYLAPHPKELMLRNHV